MSIEQVSPRDVQEHFVRGRDRLRNFRNARMMFLRNYTGPYYDKSLGKVGAEALNLIYHAVQNLLPNIAMNFPKHVVESDYLASRQYGELLGLALEYDDKRQDMKTKIRVWIVDAIFTLGIFKTGIAESDSVYVFDDDNGIDAGTVFTENVDFDNFVVDPDSMQHLFVDAKWMGDIITMSRANLLESGLYRNELIEQLPRVGETLNKPTAADLSRRSLTGPDGEFIDEVEIAELWVPGSNITLTIPGNKDVEFDDYLRVDDYYGSDAGPYTLLSLSPPVPGNPLPVPQVGVWNDIHKLANEMAEKIIDQAKRQKDVILYRPSAADDAEAMRDAADGDGIMTDDPDGVRVQSMGGQRNSNETQLASLQNWFNMMASNPQALAGQPQKGVGSATEARILQGNANIGLEDAKDLVYDGVGREAGKRTWYFHTDPLIETPLIRRDQIPAQFADSPLGPVSVSPAQTQEVQVFLTPEARRGDWLHFTFTIQSESMGRKDQATRFAEAMDFAVKIMPAALQTGQVAQLMGLPFNVKVYVERLAKLRGIDWMDEVWFDPEFQTRMLQIQMMGPSPQGSQGSVQGGNPGQVQNPLAAILQNGQPGQVAGGAPSQAQQFNQNAQEGANLGQSQLRSEGLG